MKTSKTTRTRTPEELRSAMRATLPALRAVLRQLAPLARELRQLPESRRESGVYVENVLGCCNLLEEELPGLRSMIKYLDEDTRETWEGRGGKGKAREAREALGAVFGHVSEALTPPS